MEEFRQLLLDVWREACRHVHIGEAVQRNARELFRRLPVDLVLVRRLELSRQAADTVAVGECRPGPTAGATSQRFLGRRLRAIARLVPAPARSVTSTPPSGVPCRPERFPRD